MPKTVPLTKISVITPAYNAAEFLPQTIEGVLGQTYKNLEMIIVDDGSTDATEDIIKKYPVKYIRIERSGGPATPRNVGIQHAKGKLIAFCDADDVWLPEKLKKQVWFMQKENLDLVGCDAKIIDESGNLIRPSYLGGWRLASGSVFGELYRNNFIIASSVLVKKKCLDAVGNMDRSLEGAEDYDLWLRIASRFRLGSLPEQLLLYRERAGSHSDMRIERSYQVVLNTLRKNMPAARKFGAPIRHRLFDLNYGIAIHFLKHDNLVMFFQYIGLAAWYSPIGVLQRFWLKIR